MKSRDLRDYVKPRNLTHYINSGNTENDNAVREWLDKMPKGFSLDFVKDCSRHGNPETFKIIISKN